MNHEPILDALRLFREACELPAGDRPGFLDAACAQNVALRREVESMLAWDDAVESAEDDAADHPVRRVLSRLAAQQEPAGSEQRLPASIGGYRVVRLIAHGGMGVVYEAMQEHPARRVAIKVARANATTGERARRFELEAQLLARLHHPGIARIIEAGTTPVEDGAQPFFVMEYVDGQLLTDYADQQLATARQKLELMVAVCEAVACAHREGVIHRDLKPANVLVEAGGAPRVLDFGVAKVEQASGFGAATLRTEEGRVIGTLGYMAPEQLVGASDGLGPAADVYSLGVMIYELLSRRLPHELSAATFTRALAVVTTTDAPLLGVIRPEYRGDIEALVAKALEKDPRHRYADAGALQADLQRHLRGEPILARPAGPLRSLTKWMRRNPALATAALGAFFALAAAAAVLLVKNQEVRAALDDNRRLLDLRSMKLARSDADKLWPARPERAGAMQHWLDENRQLIARLPDHRAALQRLRDRAGTSVGTQWQFADAALQAHHDELEQLVQGLEELARDTALFDRIGARQQLALAIAGKTLDERRDDWAAAIKRIADNPRYGKLVIAPQLGLVPMGEDPETHLEEFLHFETHEGPIPAAGNGAIRTLGFADNTPPSTTGIVFVLIPGGTFWMGAQKTDPGQRNFDPNMTPPEVWRGTAVHEEPVEPFFLAKYEMTGAQWSRCTGANPSAFKGARKPVQMVSWSESTKLLAQLALVLPDEKQWEYAARAGVTENPTPWWTGADLRSLEGKENLLDWTNTDRHPGWSEVSAEVAAPWHDQREQDRFDAGSIGPAPVGSYAANGFGLFDIGGNVAEWTSSPAPIPGYIVRGSTFKRGPLWARSTSAMPAAAAMAMDELGLRPARRIEPERAR